MEHGENKSGISLLQETPWEMHFMNADGKAAGCLKFDDNGDLHFSGDTDVAAKAFFTAVVKLNNQRFDDLYSLMKMGHDVVQDFLPNVGQCALQDYGRLNNFLIMAREEIGDPDG